MSDGKTGGNLKGFYIVFAIVAVLGLGALGWNVGSKAMGAGPAMEPVNLEGVLEDMRRLRELAVPVSKGSGDAPVIIAVFGDYYCNHCAAFSLQVRPRLEAELVETGKARLAFYDFVLDTRAIAGTFLAARAARCAGDQGRFWEYHDRLYRNQITWGLERDKLGTFLQYGEDLGLDSDEFRGCVNSDRYAAEVSANRELAKALGLGGTPAVMVGMPDGMSRSVRDYSFETIRDAVEEIMGGTSTN